MAILRLLGGLSLESDEGPISGRSAQRRRLALLALLAGFRRPLSRDKLIGYLWPEADTERARRLLSESLYVIRKVLGEDSLLVAGDEIRLNPGVIGSDVAEFTSAIEGEDFERAVALYAGPFLDGFFVADAPEFERWAEGERAAYARQHVEALRRLATAATAQGELQTAVRWWRELAEQDPYSGPTALGLMTALDAVGDRAGALRFAQVHAALLREELEVEPDPAVQKLLAELRAPSPVPTPPAQMRAEAPPPPAPAPVSAQAPFPPAAAPSPLGPASASTAGPAPAGLTPIQAPPPPDERPAGARPSRVSRRVALIVAGALVLTAVAAILVRRAGNRADAPGAPATRSAVVVMPFAVEGGPDVAYLEDGMADLLSTALDGAGELRTVDPQAVLAYARPRAGSGGPVGAGTVAERFQARFYVTGNVVQAGQRVRVTASLYDRDDGNAPVARASAESNLDQLFELVDHLTAQLLVGRVKGLARIAALTTRSLPALKLYLQGDQYIRLARYDRAADSFARAVSLDSSFALAYYRLSATSEWSFDFLRARRAAARALAFGERLSPPDWRLLRAWSSFLDGDAAEAERQYEELVAARPDDVEAWSGLGEVIAHYGAIRGRPITESRPHLERALALGGDYGEVRFHLLELAAVRRDSAGFSKLLVGLQPENGQYLAWHAVGAFPWGDAAEQDRLVAALERAGEVTIGIAAARTATAAHDFPAAARLARLLTSPQRARPWRAGGHIMLAELALAGGRRSTANSEFAAALPLEQSWTLELWALSRLLPFLPSSPAEIAATRDALRAWRPDQRPPSLTFFFGAHAEAHPQLRAYLLGVLSAKLGDPGDARLRLQELRTIGSSPEAVALRESLGRSLRAQIALEEGKAAEARTQLADDEFHPHLEQIALSPFYALALERFTRAMLAEQAGDTGEALRWFATLDEGYDFMFAAPAHLHEARILDRLGRTADAREHYARFVRLWQHADPDLQPTVEAARRRLTQLTPASD